MKLNLSLFNRNLCGNLKKQRFIYLVIVTTALGFSCTLQEKFQGSPPDSKTTMDVRPSYERIAQSLGEPLPPRKDYDLKQELADFWGCNECRASSERKVIQGMLLNSNKEKFIIWVLREDGQLVIGEGPDEYMSHGVLATLNMKDPKKTVGPMGRVFAGGEGFLDRNTNTLFITNKSGHFRPDFSRVKHSLVTSLFQQVLGCKVNIVPVDQTKKPRSTEVTLQ